MKKEIKLFLFNFIYKLGGVEQYSNPHPSIPELKEEFLNSSVTCLKLF